MRFVTAKEAKEYFRINGATLRMWRLKGKLI